MVKGVFRAAARKRRYYDLLFDGLWYCEKACVNEVKRQYNKDKMRETQKEKDKKTES